jgi:hypothetical protein
VEEEVWVARLNMLLKVRNWRSLNLIEEERVEFIEALKSPSTIGSRLEDIACWIH